MIESIEPQHSEASPQPTPGPWRPVSNVFTYDVFGPEGDLIAHVLSPADPDVTASVNANLIAAAPDLLAALKEAWRFAQRQRAKWPEQFWPEWWRLAQPAIDKAEGRDAK